MCSYFDTLCLCMSRCENVLYAILPRANGDFIECRSTKLSARRRSLPIVPFSTLVIACTLSFEGRSNFLSQVDT